MSQENVEAFKRATKAGNRRDFEAMLEELDPEVEWHPGMPALLGGETKVYRGHEGVRELVRDLDESFADFHTEYSEIRDLGDRLVAIGRIRTVGKASGAVTESPFCYVGEFRHGKVVGVRTFLDPKEALEAV